MTDALSHRGPDADGHWIDTSNGVALGHRRLSIVDLSPTGSQPMRSVSGRYTMVFNGEVYNHRPLRAQREADTRFRGTSDTEVMLAFFEAMGVEASVKHFNGMFACAVWDAAEGCLWLIRDRLGEKPLYYAQFGNSLAFASELKALVGVPGFPQGINVDAVADVLERGCTRGERSIFSAAKRLLPGMHARIQPSNEGFKVVTKAYWSVDAVAARTSGSSAFADDDAATDALETLLLDVIRDEMVADVPVGAFLSGGIDSSLIVALMQKASARPVRTFTIGFKEASHDESPFARAVASHLGTDHTEVILSVEDALEFVERMPSIFDEPFADSSQLPTLLVAAITRKHVTVSLSGDGGDELFGGYSQYVQRDTLGNLLSLVPSVFRAPMRKALMPVTLGPLTQRLSLLLDSDTPTGRYDSLLSMFPSASDVLSPERVAQLSACRELPSWPRAATHAESQMAFDLKTYLPDDILVKVDRTAMTWSLETRAPFLDHRVVEFAMEQPLHRKIRDGRGKYLLRRVLARHIPQHLIDRPKQGFAIPLATWLRGPLKQWANDLLQPDDVLRDWFQPSVVRDLWRQHEQGHDRSWQLWPLVVTMQWLRRRA